MPLRFLVRGERVHLRLQLVGCITHAGKVQLCLTNGIIKLIRQTLGSGHVLFVLDFQRPVGLLQAR